MMFLNNKLSPPLILDFWATGASSGRDRKNVLADDFMQEVEDEEVGVSVYATIGGFHQWAYPQLAGWFLFGNIPSTDDLGHPHLWKPPHTYLPTYITVYYMT